MPPTKVINVHTHLHKWQDVKERVKLWEECGLVKVCIQILAREEEDGTYTNEEFIPIMNEYRDIMVGMGNVDLGWEPDEPDKIDWLKENGFTGLKFIRPSYPYDNEIYFPLYARAEELGMPILFHTGFLAIHDGDADLGVSTDKMRALRLDTIGRAFPDLRMMCGHIGQPMYDEGLGVIKDFKNIWGEYSGSSGSPAKETTLKRVFQPLPGIDMSNPDENLALVFYEKLCFSTDNPEPPRWLELNAHLLEFLQIPEELQEKFYWKNAVDWLGIEL